MKQLTNLIIILVSFLLIACDKNEIIERKNDMNENIEGILSFKSYEEFTSTLDRLSKMTTEERIGWEKSQDFISFGTMCNDFYNQVEPSSFKEMNEVEEFVKQYSKYVQLYEDAEDIYFDIQEFNNPERFLMNSDKMFVIGNQVYKKIEDTYVNTDVINLKDLKVVSDISDISSNSKFEIRNNINKSKAPSSEITKDEGWGNAKIGNDTYRLKVWIETFYLSNYGPESRVVIKFRSYTRSLAIYWGMEAPVTATFTYGISNYKNENLNHTYTHSGWVQAAGYEYLAGVRFVTKDTTPFFTDYNCYAYNTVTKNDGRSCNCEVRLMY